MRGWRAWWGGGIQQKRGRTYGHRQQCGDHKGRGWVEVEEDIGGISGDEKYIEIEHIKNLGEIFLNK